MNIVLLDTNIVSFIFKGDNRLQPYEQYLKENILSISFMTVAELLCNITELPCNIAHPWRGMVTTGPHTKNSSLDAYMHPCNHTTMQPLMTNDQ